MMFFEFVPVKLIHETLFDQFFFLLSFLEIQYEFKTT